jgi:hypothetical protein
MTGKWDAVEGSNQQLMRHRATDDMLYLDRTKLPNVDSAKVGQAGDVSLAYVCDQLYSDNDWSFGIHVMPKKARNRTESMQDKT